MIDTLVISIGGIKGISFIGVLEELFKKISFKDDIKYIIGSSVGSIIGLLLTLEYTPDEIFSICTEIDFSKFTLNKCDKLDGCINSEICSLQNLNSFGLDDCSGMIRLLKSVIHIKCSSNITFKEHYEKYKKELTIVATDIDDLSAKYFNYKETPDEQIINIIKLSISIPIIYIKQNYKNINYTDGGISNYYPIDYYNLESSIGICLIKTNADNIKRKNDDILNYILNIVNSLEIYMNSLLYKLYTDYTIFVNTGLMNNDELKGPGNFGIRLENKNKLYEYGKKQFLVYYKDHKSRFELNNKILKKK